VSILTVQLHGEDRAGLVEKLRPGQNDRQRQASPGAAAVAGAGDIVDVGYRSAPAEASAASTFNAAASILERSSDRSSLHSPGL
jgi:hypothetical protein